MSAATPSESEKDGTEVLLRTFPEEAHPNPHPPLDHLGVAEVLESGAARGMRYAAVELLQGPTLLQAGGGAGALLRALLPPVALAQGRGIVHGHLRPHNVHVVPGRGPVIADYGLPEPRNELDVYRDVFAYLAAARRPPRTSTAWA